MSHRKGMLADRATQPWDVLETGLTRIGVKSLAKNAYLLLVVDKAFRSPFAFRLTSRQADDGARHLLP